MRRTSTRRNRELTEDAIGLFVQNLNMALGIFEPVVGKQLPTFTAMKLTADSAGFVDGDSDIFEMVAEGITVELNLGGAGRAGPVDWNDRLRRRASRRTRCPAPTSRRVTAWIREPTSAPIYLDFQGERILASVEWAEITISEFVHIAGSFAFEKGAIETVQVTGGLLTGLTGPAVSAILDPLGITLPAAFAIPATGATTAQLSFMTIGASNVHAFIGMNGPYWTDTERRPGHRRGRDKSTKRSAW